MTGEITAVGGSVTGFRVGDQVAVGNIIDSCGVRPPCVRRHRGQGRAWPYRSEDRPPPRRRGGPVHQDGGQGGLGTLCLIDTAAARQP
ncbi:hypothetical protein [Streptomyces microflavus]|uniref:hypothetical protein n=1 Tax=Streptomyces microflavus TaxID=1919 RepID=UPI003F4D0181